MSVVIAIIWKPVPDLVLSLPKWHVRATLPCADKIMVPFEGIFASRAYPGMRSFRISLLFFSAALFVGAQPTFNAISRTFRVQSKYGTGTMFSIDVDSREYWVTATHILTGAKGKPFGRVAEKTVELKLLNPGGSGREWLPLEILRLAAYRGC